MNEQTKKLFKHLKGKGGKGFLGVFLLILALFPAVIGVTLTADSYGVEPVKYSSSLPKGTYCYMDVMYMTETYAETTNYGITTDEYCLAADSEFDWVAVSISPSKYKEFADIVEYTYSEETDGPGTIRITGSIMTFDSEIRGYTDDYTEYLFGYGSGICEDGRYIQIGMNNDLTGGLIMMGLGLICAILGIFVVAKGGSSKRAAKKTIAALSKNGELDAALAEFASPESMHVGIGKKTPDCILGNEYLFLAGSGKIMRYNEINCMSIQAVHTDAVAAARVLNVHDANGTQYPVVTEPLNIAGTENSLLDACIKHIQQRNENARVI